METGHTDGHKHHLRDLSVFDCVLCPDCNGLFYAGGDDPPEQCPRCDTALEDVRLDCEPRLQGFDLPD